MLYHKARSPQRQMELQDVFAGYDHNPKIGFEEFYDMENLTSDYAPVLAPRGPRGVVSAGGNYQGLICKDGLCYVDGEDLIINGYHHPMRLSTDPEDCPKQLVGMGAYIVIFPDGKYINTVDTTDAGSINAAYTSTGTVTLTPCRSDGTEIKADYTQDSAPDVQQDKTIWIDTSVTPHQVKEYEVTTALWAVIATTYVKISCSGIGADFKIHDGIKLSGFKTADTAGDQIEDLEGAAVVFAQDNNSITIIGMLDKKRTIERAITVSREAPLMDFVIESGNRLWGCRYGPNNAGKIVNELYASKLGDFKNWFCFEGISTDSYTVSLGSDGAFTGAVTLGGYPTFFKETCLHKVFGQFPANFSVQASACRGVQKGCSRSLAIVNEVLYYKSRSGVCSYDGALPHEISPQLGGEIYGNAVGASCGNKYFVSMEDAQGKWSLFVYDAAKGLWHREDDLHAYLMCQCKDDIFCVDAAGRMLALRGTAGDPEPDPVHWMAETGPIGASMPGEKYLCKLSIRMVLEPGSQMAAYVQYDSTGPWDCIGTARGMDLRSFVYPIVPRRCDHLRVRLVGEGAAKVFSVVREMQGGSDC